MPGLYTIVTRAAGTLITALVYNFDHQQHVDGRTATLVQSYGTTITQFNITEDPLPGGVESLPSSLAGEIARLRFDIAALKTALSGNVPVNWYDNIATPAFATIGARVVRTTNQSIPNNTATNISFTPNTASFNSGVWSGVNPTRFTAPATGKYYAACSITWNASGVPIAGSRRVRVGVNGVFGNDVSMLTVDAATTGTQHQAMTGLVNLVAADFIEFEVLQTSGAALNLIPETDQSIVGCLVFLGS
jgi:hypothetical protein